ncbi:uncharacterized protein HMPREF1541_05635 [Cyphellophora europaea CBS 101466]|uniref:DNA-directed RNA polymerase III subunit n=1 Tax=Cyphellophora europaea (strain CBS 101466) TaxID=1220924 RepID=W2RSK4_CYPE1|nr:uncharacterized protein HMPREF1541_05635 [Cyphellophora europaea CBS 101466]ETN39412.1 hypothetical protein HMPREF1541_05635 [Cyphellophora europaea CBS 101466]
MPRGGGRFGGGGRKLGPDMAWDDEEPAPVLLANKPAATFPEVVFPIPRALDQTELASTTKYLSFRSRARNGPFYAALDPSILTDDNGKVAPRAGFDPFNDQQAYSSKFQKKRRIMPEAAGKIQALQLFPKELWPVIDPKRKNPLWSTVDVAELGGMGARKRKRRLSVEADVRSGGEDADSDEDSDAVVAGRRKQKSERSRRAEKDAKQRQGLDAEDDYPEGEPNADEEGDGEDEPEDSDFEESEDEDNDYNAENYFDAGDDDDMGGDDDDGGGGGGDFFS